MKDVTDSGGKPPCVRVLVWLAKPVPFGRAIIVYIPACAAPWKGAQPSAEERAKTKGLNLAQERGSTKHRKGDQRSEGKGHNQAQKRCSNKCRKEAQPSEGKGLNQTLKRLSV